MRIALLTLHTPTATNTKGASALPYHLLKFRRKDISAEIWSLNLNHCSKEVIEQSGTELDVKIHTIPVPKRMRWMKSPYIRIFLPKPLLCYIHISSNVIDDIEKYLSADNQGGLFIYGEELARYASMFKKYNIGILPPDCEAMYYYRMLSQPQVPIYKRSLLRYGLMYHRYAKITADYPTGTNIKYFLVGKEDAAFLRMINPLVQAQFLQHPHYDISKNICQNEVLTLPIRLLIAGQCNHYMAEAMKEAVKGMIRVADSIKEYYHITFLGKGWADCIFQLKRVGFDIEHKDFVDDYAAEVASHEIQLTPINVGTGTKGKVLDAFANGLMVIGTLRALENIAVESGKSCVQYETGGELANWLIKLAKDRQWSLENCHSEDLIKKIAKAGREAVLANHGRKKIADEFFSWFE